MSRLIDADELLTAFPVDDEPTLTKSCVRMTIRHMPTVDAVPVVRCKDCKHWDTSDVHSTICPNNKRCKGTIGKMYTAPDYYCAYGERKDG